MKLKKFFKRHIGMIILLIILLVFPISLTSQSKLNMRIIVTGVAIDMEDDAYKVTAQVVKAKPGNESPGTSAEIDFVTETGETISDAISKLVFKTGKISAFSHTNFVVIGGALTDVDEAVMCLDLFVRDKIIRSSALVLFAEEDASEEIKKTKDAELSIGLGLQKVFLYKQEESDGLMMTVIEFLNKNNNFSKTTYASTLSLGSDEEVLSSGSSESESGSSGGGSSESESGSGGSGNGSENSSSSTESSSGGSSGSVYFKPLAPIYIFDDGKKVCSLENADELMGFMLANKKTRRANLTFSEIENENLSDAKVSVDIKNKSYKSSVRYEEEIPCLDITININNSDIVEILSEKSITDINDEEYEAIENALKTKIKELVGTCFSKCQEAGADVFGAYEFATKYNYSKTQKYYKDDISGFIKNLKLNVAVNVLKLDY